MLRIIDIWKFHFMVCKIKVAKNCGLNVCLVNISGNKFYCVIMLLMFKINRWIIFIVFHLLSFLGKMFNKGRGHCMVDITCIL